MTSESEDEGSCARCMPVRQRRQRIISVQRSTQSIDHGPIGALDPSYHHLLSDAKSLVSTGGGAFVGTEKGPLDGTERGPLDGTAVCFSANFFRKRGASMVQRVCQKISTLRCLVKIFS